MLGAYLELQEILNADGLVSGWKAEDDLWASLLTTRPNDLNSIWHSEGVQSWREGEVHFSCYADLPRMRENFEARRRLAGLGDMFGRLADYLTANPDAGLLMNAQLRGRGYGYELWVDYARKAVVYTHRFKVENEKTQQD